MRHDDLEDMAITEANRALVMRTSVRRRFSKWFMRHFGGYFWSNDMRRRQ